VQGQGAVMRRRCAGGFARRRRGRGDRRRCAAIGGSGGAGKDRVTSRKTSTASPDRCCSGGGLFVVVFGEVAVEGGAADADVVQRCWTCPGPTPARVSWISCGAATAEVVLLGCDPQQSHRPDTTVGVELPGMTAPTLPCAAGDLAACDDAQPGSPPLPVAVNGLPGHGLAGGGGARWSDACWQRCWWPRPV
jgi:hypothetical protein